MKYWLLVTAGLRRKPVRTVLTAVAIVFAFLLFGVMHGVVAGFDYAVDRMSDTRLRVVNRANIIESLPLAHRQRIEGVKGVRAVSHATIFGGYYKELTSGVSAAAVDLSTFLDVFEGFLVISDEEIEALAHTRTGAVVGSGLAERHGWKLGDKVPLKSFIWRQEDGSDTWTFDVVGIAYPEDAEDEMFANEMFFHYDYLDESRAAAQGTVHQFVLGIDDAEQADRIARDIDALFANSMYETNTMNDKQWVRSQLQRVGDVQLFVNYVLGAVLFTLLFLTGTTLMQSMRERTSEFGILKSLGFTDLSVFVVIVIEALVLCVGGAALGLLLAGTVFPAVFGSIGFGGSPLPGEVYTDGLAVALLVAVLVAIWPALRARRLTIAEAVSGR